MVKRASDQISGDGPSGPAPLPSTGDLAGGGVGDHRRALRLYADGAPDTPYLYDGRHFYRFFSSETERQGCARSVEEGRLPSITDRLSVESAAPLLDDLESEDGSDLFESIDRLVAENSNRESTQPESCAETPTNTDEEERLQSESLGQASQLDPEAKVSFRRPTCIMTRLPECQHLSEDSQRWDGLAWWPAGSSPNGQLLYDLQSAGENANDRSKLCTTIVGVLADA